MTSNKTDQTNFYQRLGENIKAIREKRKVNQEGLALELGLTRVSISNIEAGKQKIQLYSLAQLANFLKVDVVDLVPEIVSENTNISDIDKRLSNSEISNSPSAMEGVKAFITKKSK